MTPPAGVNAQLRQLIHYHLDNGFLENAFFLAGRLSAHDPRLPDSSHLLALCSLRLGRYKAAFDYAKAKGMHLSHLGCAFVYAQACLALERYELGVQALEKVRGLWMGRNHWNKHSETSRRHVPDAAACYCLLGKLSAAHGDSKKAIEYFVEALKINSFMWDAFTGLCDTGAVVRPQNIFQITPDMLASISHAATNGHAPHVAAPQESHDSRNPFVSTPDVDPFNPASRQAGDGGLSLGGSNLMSRLNGSNQPQNGQGGGSLFRSMDTPIANGQNIHDEDVMMGEGGGPVMHEQADMALAPSRKPRTHGFNATEEPPRMRPITSRMRTKTNPESDQTDIPRPINQNGHKRTVSGHSLRQPEPPNAQPQPHDPTAAPPRRSVRLLNSISQSVQTRSNRLGGTSSRDQESQQRRELRRTKTTASKSRTGTTSTVGRVVSGNRKPHADNGDTVKPEPRPASAAATAAPPPRMGPPPIDTNRERDAINWLLELLLDIGTGYRHLSRYDSARALEAFTSVSKAHRDTPWVLAQIGKAYYERAQYAEAENAFRRVRELAPSHMEHMEVYSNTLWQRKEEVALGHLAHTLMDQDRLSPQAWCALGNASSLDRQHDDAVKCFARATQLDPKFAYAFTLQGHEHVANEEFDKAMAAYRNAISADNRHYNGWYGLGSVYERLGKYEVAEKHYRAAAQINPNNAMILVRIGLVLDRLKSPEPALLHFDLALKLDPRSIMARFRKAQLLLKLQSPDEALHELLYLVDAAPDDANIHFLLGRCYKRLGDRASAVRHLTVAMNLDPKSHAVVKEVLEGIEGEGEEGWSSEDER